MLKFVKREHYKKGEHGKKIVIVYSISEVIMGALLIVLVAFFALNYLDYNLNKHATSPNSYTNSTTGLKATTTTTTKKTTK